MAQTIGTGQQNDTPERTGTVLETDEDIRQALLSGLKGQQQSVPVDRSRRPTPKAAAVPPARSGRRSAPQCRS